MLVRSSEAGRADDVVIDPPLEDDVKVVEATGFDGGRFSLMNSIMMGASCLIDTRFSVLTLPECFRMESRRGRTGDVACEGHALTEMYA